MIELGANRYGKAAIRIVRVGRDRIPHDLHDLTVAVALEGDFTAAHTDGDNRLVIATDTMKNTAYAFAAEHLAGSIETYATELARHFVAEPQVLRATVNVREHAWRAIEAGGSPAPDAFLRTDEGIRVATVAATHDGVVVEAGVEDLVVMKTTRSGFSGFPRDRYTTLAETDDRLMATKVTAIWRYGAPDIEYDAAWAAIRGTLLEVFADHDSPSVQTSIWIMASAMLERHQELIEVRMVLPNLHHWLADLSPFGMTNDQQVYVATTEPHGLIEATVRRGDLAGGGGTLMAVPGVKVRGSAVPGSDRILTDDALGFVADLQRRFGPVRLDLLRRREERQAEMDAGVLPDFLVGTRDVRDADWRVAPAPADLDDRRVEITGPAEPKMMINALNSGARVFMADLEDALSPTWANVVAGQAAIADATRGTLTFTSSEGKAYQLAEERATLVVRPRGWHLVESHVLVDDVPVSASLFDAGLYLFHSGAAALEAGSGPYLYLAKLESHHEATLWNEVFIHAQQALHIPRGSIRATVLIETILAAFEMDEILHELREHAAGLNAGRWDYLFSAIKKFRTDPAIASPDRAQLTMTQPFMRAYTELLVQTCHRRGAHAIGGMAAFIPNRRDPAVTEVALAKVRADKERESGDGFDGTWVAHPDLVQVALEVFDEVLGSRPNQKDRTRDEVSVTAAELLDLTVADGAVTLAGVRANVRVALAYLDSWLRGIGAAAIDNLMEDAATAEISRSQLWLWITQGVLLDDGEPFSPERYETIRNEELARLGGAGEGRLAEAADLLDRLVLDDDFAEFLTLRAYSLLE